MALTWTSEQIARLDDQGGTAVGRRIWEILVSCHGQENSISARQICDALGWSPGAERHVREIIEREGDLYAKEFAVFLCAQPGIGGGFFIAQSADEIANRLEFLERLRDIANEKLKRARDVAAVIGIYIPEKRRAA